VVLALLMIGNLRKTIPELETAATPVCSAQKGGPSDSSEGKEPAPPEPVAFYSLQHPKEFSMTMLTKVRDGLAGSAAVALVVATCAWPAAAQTNTTPTDNGAACSGSGANSAACTNNQTNTGTTPGTGGGVNDSGTDSSAPTTGTSSDTNVTNPGGGSSGGTTGNTGTSTGTGTGTGGSSGGGSSGGGSGGSN
jgi:hypothetical protein